MASQHVGATPRGRPRRHHDGSLSPIHPAVIPTQEESPAAAASAASHTGSSPQSLHRQGGQRQARSAVMLTAGKHPPAKPVRRGGQLLRQEMVRQAQHDEGRASASRGDVSGLRPLSMTSRRVVSGQRPSGVAGARCTRQRDFLRQAQDRLSKLLGMTMKRLGRAKRFARQRRTRAPPWTTAGVPISAPPARGHPRPVPASAS
jgi:hypothetical protein